MATKFKMSEEERERELERKLERNRVAFEGWLDRKNEEQKKIIAEKKKAAQFQLEIAAQKQGVGEAAFRNWLKRKRMEDEVLKKDRTVQREVRKLKEQEMKEKRKRAEESFSRWKSQKDLDLRLQRSNERHRTRSASPQKREPTPPVPGYCSVWSCDLDLASYITDHVPRGDNDLTDVKPFIEQNFTVCHDPT